ncbi:hypothetical protein BH09PLA1_BH09PLA1_07540 [soil metagenome]
MLNRRMIGLAMLCALFLCAAGPADELAEQVMKANGAQNWSKIARIKFSWCVDRGEGKKIVRSHDWNIRRMTDTVTVDGKTMTCQVTGTNDTQEAKDAFAAWTNDSYWMMAPMKIMDGGVNRTVKPDETIDGKTYHVLHLSFGTVGLTPGDQYNQYIDPETNLLGLWDYISAGGEPKRFTWEDYKDFNGVKIATMHKMNGKPVIRIENVSVTTD